MRIQTEYKSFKNHWTISSSYDFQAHQECSQRWCFSQTALQWCEVLPGLCLALQCVPKLITITSMVFLCQLSEIQVTLSVNNRSKLPGQFRFQFHPKPDSGNGSYHTKNQAHWKWASFTPKHPAFQHHNSASNEVIKFWSYRDMISTSIVQF